MKDIYRVGIGYDIHRLVKGRKLFLGGVQIEHPKGLLGHSDADVLLHAVCDALLGAAGLDDIGVLFPDTDARYKDIRSTELLKRVLRLVGDKGFKLVNLDTTIVAQAPRIYSLKLKIQKNISKILKLSLRAINLKATTAERLGDVGRNKAIAAWCVVLLRRVR
ncbi:2-C-methyl-D-erythritol 2,4-cyclodiphosphate synthase [Candidatus Omnitrophota bacterium]